MTDAKNAQGHYDCPQTYATINTMKQYPSTPIAQPHGAPQMTSSHDEELEDDIIEVDAVIETEAEVLLDEDDEENEDGFLNDEVEYRQNSKAHEAAAAILGDLSLPMLRDSDFELSAQTDPLTAYLARLNYIEPLPADKQQELAERYINDNDVNAAKMLILTNLRLVVKLAREYQRRWTNLLDLIQEIPLR